MVRSFSDQLLSFKDNAFSMKGNISPDSVLPMKHKRLENIMSGQKQEVGAKRGGKKKWRNKREKGICSTSLTELEFEEVKGFMDLGFVFFEEDKYTILGSIIPGLHRLGKNDHGHGGGGGISRPYLSESWEMLDRKNGVNDINDLLKNWRIPSELISSEIDMKNFLRVWAHTVASTVR